MNKVLAVLAMALLLVSSTLRTLAAEAETASAREELKALVTKIQTKLQNGVRTEEALRAEFEEFDAILEKHKSEKNEDVASVLFVQALLYIEVFENYAKGEELLRRLKSEFPETTLGQNTDGILASLAKDRDAGLKRAALKPGTKFPDFTETDLNGQPLSVSQLKGKVVLVNFWATWCGPCVAALPGLLKIHGTYHPRGFEIIGISLDQDKEQLQRFVAENKIPWPQYFDGLGWRNKLAVQYGVNSTPMYYLLDRAGSIIKANPALDELEAAVAKAVAVP